ncbi:MAG: hypothetical protein GXP62_18130 [Oligoflexia bacterium]|nr:hypothetical protein [Oligoflexia bacterium]
MIPQRNISLLSNRLAREGGRRIPETVLERDYCLAWFLVGLSRSPLRDQLAFKGGTALKRCYFGDYRFSEDLDFTLTEELPLEDIFAALDGIFAEVARIHFGTGQISEQSWIVRYGAPFFFLVGERTMRPLPHESSRPKPCIAPILSPRFAKAACCGAPSRARSFGLPLAGR